MTTNSTTPLHPCRRCGKLIRGSGNANCTPCKKILRAKRDQTHLPEPVRKDYTPAWEWLVRNSPARKIDFARRVNWNAQKADSILAEVERNGYLLSEDDKGLIYPFARLA